MMAELIEVISEKNPALGSHKMNATADEIRFARASVEELERFVTVSQEKAAKANEEAAKAETLAGVMRDHAVKMCEREQNERRRLREARERLQRLVG